MKRDETLTDPKKFAEIALRLGERLYYDQSSYGDTDKALIDAFGEGYDQDKLYEVLVWLADFMGYYLEAVP